MQTSTYITHPARLTTGLAPYVLLNPSMLKLKTHACNFSVHYNSAILSPPKAPVIGPAQLTGLIVYSIILLSSR
jgi:hypothetical protein